MGILRHLSRYRPDIAFAVHEVSKTLASPGDADLRRLRRLGRYLLGTQKLGIMIRKSKDPEHLDAYTDADWSGDSINRKSTSGGVLEIGHEGSELSNVTERRKRVLRCGDDGRGIAPPTFLGILGNASPSSVANRFNGSTRHHPTTGVRSLKHIETRLLWLQAQHEERKLTVVKEPTQTNTADGFTKALQTATYLEWRNRLSMRYDNVSVLRRASGKASRNQDDGHESKLCMRSHAQC